MKKSSVIFTLMVIMTLVALSAQTENLITHFEISPNPMDRYTRIDVGLERSAEVQIVIRDLRGRVVKSLFSGTVVKSVDLYWNRHGDDGSIVASGEYEVVVSYAGRYTSVKKTLILR